MKVRILGEQIHVQVLGEGKPVVILHGIGCSMEMMQACLEPVFAKKAGYRRIYLDLPGMGASTGSLANASADAILEILMQVLAREVQGPYLLIGESYGGYLARGLLAKDMARVDGLMLLCPVVAPEKKDRTLPQRTLLFAEPSVWDGLSEEARRFFCDYGVVANPYTYRRFEEEFRKGVVQCDGAFIAELKAHYAFSFPADEQIARVGFEKPSLFLCGRQDVCVGYADVWPLLQSYPRAGFAVLDVAGHFLQTEQVPLFEALTANWLERVERYPNP